MKRIKRYILSINMLLFLFYVPVIAYGTEVRSVETEGSVGFTGIYESIGIPDPTPEGGDKRPLTIRNNINNNLPKTNGSRSQRLFFVGVLLVVLTFIFWFWKRKKRK